MESLQKLFNDFSSWYWWVSVVVVGVSINLLSAYLKDPLDRWVANRSSRASERRERSRREKRERLKKLVDGFLADARLLQISVSTEMRWRWYSLIFMLMSVLLMTMAIGMKNAPDVSGNQRMMAIAAAAVAMFSLACAMLCLEKARSIADTHEALKLLLEKEHCK